MERIFYVYILASRSRALYTGVTNNIERRLVEHRTSMTPGFASRYRAFRLVHLEPFSDIRDAIARETEIKAWRREKKVKLIEETNPTWEDLGKDIERQAARTHSEKSKRENEKAKSEQQIPHP